MTLDLDNPWLDKEEIRALYHEVNIKNISARSIDELCTKRIIPVVMQAGSLRIRRNSLLKYFDEVQKEAERKSRLKRKVKRGKK